MVSPVTGIGEVVLVPLSGPGLHVAVKLEMGDPPLDAGAVNATYALALPGDMPTIAGTPGTCAEVTDVKPIPKTTAENSLVAVESEVVFWVIFATTREVVAYRFAS